MKKRLWGVLGAVLMLGLVACNNQGETPKDTQPATQEGETGEVSAALRASVEFSALGGCYESGFDLSLTAIEGGDILYTTDGSDPRVSDTAIAYTAPIAIKDRKGEANVVAAVDPDLFCTNYVNYRQGVADCTLSAPKDDAVDKCTVIRAAAKLSSGEFGAATTQTYFIGKVEDHVEGVADSAKAQERPLAVISITMDYDDLFDYENGIYVRGAQFDEALKKYNPKEEIRKIDANYNSRGKEWERDAHVEFYETDASGMTQVISQDCGIRIQGNYSRSDLQKSFRFYAKEKYGDKKFKYSIFGDDCKDTQGNTIDSFKTFVVRAGGNCALTAKYNDTFWQSLITNDYDVSTKSSRPAVVYLNGEYWGLYVLEEDYSTDYFKSHYGIKKDDVIIYKGDAERYGSGYSLDEGDLPEGENQGYYFIELKDFLTTHKDLSKEEDFKELCTIIDEQSFMDYFAIEVWINNKWDWPGKNWSIWKSNVIDESNPYADGRWRFMIYDIEFGGVSGGSDATTNTMKEDNYKNYGLLDQDTKNVVVRTFALLMTNPDYKKAFCDRLEELSSTIFEREAALARLDWFESVYGPLYDQFFTRFPGVGSKKDAINGGYASSACIRQFLMKRADNIGRITDWTKKTLTKVE